MKPDTGGQRDSDLNPRPTIAEATVATVSDAEHAAAANSSIHGNNYPFCHSNAADSK